MPSKKEFLNALETVGQVFPTLKSIVEEGCYVLNSDRDPDLDQITKIVKIYSILKDKEELKGRNLQALCFYLENGYGKDQKDKMTRELELKSNNLNQINSNLRTMKYLIQDKHNKTKHYVDPELLKFKHSIINKEKPNLLVKFK